MAANPTDPEAPAVPDPTQGSPTTNWFDANAPAEAPAPPYTGPPGVGGTTYDRFVHDYHAPDRAAVLAAMSTTGVDPGATPSPGSGATSGGAPAVTNPTDRGQVRAFFSWLAQQPNVDPHLLQSDGVDYYTDAALREGGLQGQYDTNYWIQRTANGGDAGQGKTGGASVGGMNFGDLVKPFGAYAPPAPYQAPATYGNFTLPTIDAGTDPGYLFTKQQGTQAIQADAAKRGTLLGGSTLKALDTFNAGLANQTYNDVYNRALGAYNANSNTYGLNAGVQKNAYDTNNQTGYNAYLANRDTFYANQTNPFNKWFSVANLGANAAGR